MAKVTLNVSSIQFENPSEMLDHVMKYLKRQWKRGVDDITPFVGNLVYASLKLAADASEQGGLIHQLCDAIHDDITDVVKNDVTISLAQTIQILEAGGAVQILPVFNLNEVVTFDENFEPRHAGYIFNVEFVKLLKKVAAGDLVVDDIQPLAFLKTPETMAASMEHFSQQDE